MIDGANIVDRYGVSGGGLLNVLSAHVAEGNRYVDEAEEIAEALAIPIDSARRIQAADWRGYTPLEDPCQP